MGGVLLRNGRIIDPSVGRDQTGDLFVRDGRIAERPEPGEPVEVVDCSGLVVTPGLIDMHTHVLPGLGDFCVPARPGGSGHGGAGGDRRRHQRRRHLRHQPARRDRPPRDPHQGAGLHRPRPALPGHQGLHLPPAAHRRRPREPRRRGPGRQHGAQRRGAGGPQGAGLPRRRPRAQPLLGRGAGGLGRQAGHGAPGPLPPHPGHHAAGAVQQPRGPGTSSPTPSGGRGA